MTPDDAILPFHLTTAGIRGRIVRLEDALTRILDQHRYPEPVSALVADAVLLTSLIGQAIKLKWRFSVQIRAEGAVRLLATDYFAPLTEDGPARIRAYASFDRGEVASARLSPFELLGKGVMGVTIDQGAGMTPYQGITPLTGGSLCACAETYFAQSEQLATRFHTLVAQVQTPGAAPRWRAGGLMVQQMPAEGGIAGDEASGDQGLLTAKDVAGQGERAEDWHRVDTLAGTVEETELIGPHPSPEDLLVRLFHEEAPSVHPAQPVIFGCTCSAERVEIAMHQYSAKDISRMTNADGKLTADCQFCSAHYEFDPRTLGFEADPPAG